MKYSIAICSIVAALALGACTQSAPPTSVVKPIAKVDPANAVRTIRAAGAGVDSAVQVHPLRDPAIDGFLKKANEAEARNDIAAAIDAANKALKLAPDAPEIVQYLAELEVARGDWSKADQLAMKSFALGPKVGGLCARNWQTVIEARTALGDAATVAQARLRLKECRVP
ncbi:MAG: tetratricopeptide repeat protein, partial [Dokdonella sp.]